MVLLMLLCLPILLGFIIYTKLVQRKAENKAAQAIDKVLETGKIKYDPDSVKGDHECRICFSTYSLNEELVILPCNQSHHFHYSCLSLWLKASPSCPMCRHNFGEEAPDAQEP